LGFVLVAKVTAVTVARDGFIVGTDSLKGSSQVLISTAATGPAALLPAATSRCNTSVTCVSAPTTDARSDCPDGASWDWDRVPAFRPTFFAIVFLQSIKLCRRQRLCAQMRY
jgi:hypothetical protein